MKCAICGAENPNDAEFCAGCRNRIPRISPEPPASRVWAWVAGLAVGSVIGLLMAALIPYWPGPPYIYAALLIYALGGGVFLVLQLSKGLFREDARPHITPFSTGFVVTYYVFLIGYLMYLVG
ncbi:MAG: hypothetical protein MUC90_05375 [Thermoplasmata archaeon]|nr:hypothetical protein [Thermoplasmata archaeon]